MKKNTRLPLKTIICDMCMARKYKCTFQYYSECPHLAYMAYCTEEEIKKLIDDFIKV